MAPILYMAHLSPPSRAVLITAQALSLEVELRHIDLSKGEHCSPEYLKLNPLHAVPTLIDGSIIISDSHVINAYLVSKYAPNDDLYPRELGKRALVDQRLHFDTGILFNHFRAAAGAIFYKKAKEVSHEQKDQVLEAYKFLETILNESHWMAGDKVTIADFSIGTTLLSLDLLVLLDSEVFPKTAAWVERFQDLTYTKINEGGLQQLKDLFAKLLAKI